MNTIALLQLALVCIAAVLALMGAAIAARRAHRDVSLRRRARREAALRPKLIALLSDDNPDLAQIERVTGIDARVLESLVWKLLPKVRGVSRDVLVQWLEQSGSIERARRRTHKLGAVGRAKAAEKLGSAGVVSTSADVSRLLEDRHIDVRIVAARALGKLGAADAVVPLLRSLEGKKPVPAGIVSMALIHIGPSAVENLTQGLADRSEIVRAVSVELLGMHGAIGSARWIANLLDHDQSDSVRVKAAEALGRIGVPQAVEPLRRGLAAGRTVDIRIAGAQALGRVGGDDALDALQAAVISDSARVAEAAAEALAGAGPKGEERLISLAGSDGLVGLRATQWMVREQIHTNNRRQRAHFRAGVDS